MGMQIAAVGSSVSARIGMNPFPQHEVPDSGAPRKTREPSKRADIRSASSDLERVSLAFNKRLQFMVDHESHDITVKVIDRETDKVIKVLPPEELQRLHAKIRETIGFLFDEKV